MTVVGRFAPSPTGPLHAGSAVAALASWLDARARGGHWLVRIEDVDAPRCPPEAEAQILQQLAALHLHPDAAPQRQSARTALYAAALQRLRTAGLAYPCACTRKEIEGTLRGTGVLPDRHGERVYPGTCRAGLNGRPARAWRLHTEALGSPEIDWTDRRLGPQRQNVAAAVGDFVLRRADGLWAYQLAVVVDDAEQGITDVVRGEDLADNTARQILLQRALGLPAPRYLHVPVVRAADGQKLSKQNGAPALDTSHPVRTLREAARHLGLPDPPAWSSQAARGASGCDPLVGDALAWWTAAWGSQWPAATR